jgi:hypothetical protein
MIWWISNEHRRTYSGSFNGVPGIGILERIEARKKNDNT